ALGVAAGEVTRRTEGASGRAAAPGRRVVVLTFGVQAYSSALVPHLPGTLADLEAYGAALKAALSGTTARVEVRPPVQPETADDLLQALKSERDGLGPDDLLILVYSGRGIEIGGRRYLTPARVTARMEAPELTNVGPSGQAAQQSTTWDPAQFLDLWQVAETVGDRWFVGLYDAQFTEPRSGEASGGPVRADQLLDKHLDSVRPRPEAPESAQRAAGIRASQVVRSGGQPPRQLHIWVEGTLTARPSRRHRCLPDAASAVASPLAAAVIGALSARTPGTYRDWLAQISVSECLGSGTQVVAQGNVDVPLFASGQAAELVDVFQKDMLRHALNLQAARAVTAFVARKFPSVRTRLSHAAVLLAQGVLRGRAPAPHQVKGDLAESLRAAQGELDAAGEPAAEDVTLGALRAELFSRRFLLAGDPEQARRALRGAEPPRILSERGLARRLVALTAESMNRQPETLLNDALETLAALSTGSTGTDVMQALSDLEALMRKEQARVAAPYAIGPAELRTLR
ncbi:MAG TPA: hypothetical protein VFO85_01200, partial [Vicinamibacteria bacterium]|nr:hypothetical protein [Vicinamibacteria bacterium]